MPQGIPVSHCPGSNSHILVMSPEPKAAFQAAGVPFDASDPNLNTDGPSGPASFVVVDPDGNPILIDQHR